MKKIIIAICSSSIIGAFIGFIIGSFLAAKRNNEKYKKSQKLSDKHFSLYKMMTDWVMLLLEGRNIYDYIKENGYKKVAIFGMSYVGNCLAKELKEKNLDLLYGIDNAENIIWTEIPVVTIHDDLEDVDLVIVTSITSFNEIKEQLDEKLDCTICSLEEILFELRSK